MSSATAKIRQSAVVVEIGGVPIRLRCDNAVFLEQIEERYAGYVSSSSGSGFDFEIRLAPPDTASGDEELEVTWKSGRWLMKRGDFRAEWNPFTLRGRIEQTINPFSLDSVLRILHTLVLAREGGFLVHASSAIRNGRAFLFSGVSGAGKTTMARLAPPDVVVLTDEASYVTRSDHKYFAAGTRAPIEGLYLLAKGFENKIEPIAGAEAVRALLRNILFFAREPDFVEMVFDAALAFIDRVPIRRLTFAPTSRVWEMFV